MSEIFDSIQVSDDVKRFVDHSFDVVDQIHEILESQGKTQRDLADLLGKKESEISKWMRGTHNFTLKSISKIEAALGEKIMTTPLKEKSLSESRANKSDTNLKAKVNKVSIWTVYINSPQWTGSAKGNVVSKGIKVA